MTLRQKYIELVQRTIRGNRCRRRLIILVGGIILFGALGLFIFLTLQADKILGWPAFPGGSVTKVIGWVALGGGSGLSVWSLLHFLKARGTPAVFSPPPNLVTSGPYAYARNPMLTGAFVAIFGLGLILASVGIVCVFMPLFIILMVWHIVFLEEPELEDRLGDVYIRYKKDVGRFLPRAKRKDSL